MAMAYTVLVGSGQNGHDWKEVGVECKDVATDTPIGNVSGTYQNANIGESANMRFIELATKPTSIRGSWLVKAGETNTFTQTGGLKLWVLNESSTELSLTFDVA